MALAEGIGIGTDRLSRLRILPELIMKHSADLPTILQGSCCGSSYRGYPPRAAEPSVCPACELLEILAERPTPEEDDLDRMHVAYEDVPRAHQAEVASLWASMRPSAAICALLGLPPGAAPDVTFFWGDGFRDAKDAARWSDFRAELVHMAPSAFGRPHPWSEPLSPDSEPQVLLHWRVWRHGVSGVLQVWHDFDSKRERRRADDLDVDGLGRMDDFLAAVRDSRRRGRPIGSGVPTSEQFREQLALAFQECADRDHRRPTQLAVGAQMGLEYTTFRDRLRRHSINWRRFADEQLAANSSAFCRQSLSACAWHTSLHGRERRLMDAGNRTPPSWVNDPDQRGKAKTAKLLLTVPEAAACLSVSRAHLYRFLQTGELRAVHSRGAVRVSVAELERYVSLLMSEGR